MPHTPLSLSQQLVICQQVARLTRAKLPIAGELSRLTKTAQPHVAQAAQTVDDRLSAGEELSTALADVRTRHGRVLAACIEVGQRSGRLADSLHSWTAMHVACGRYTQALRTAMLYPVLLILITLLSLGYVFWRLVPEYRNTYALFSQRLPSWLEGLDALHEWFWLFASGVLVLTVGPLLLWLWHLRGRDRLGLPRDRARRLRVQALATELAALGLAAKLPLNQLIPWCVRASGGEPAAADAAVELVQQQQLPPQLSRETSLLLCSLQAGLIALPEAERHLTVIAEHLRTSADRAATRAARWLPMFVALTVGVTIILAYVLLVYLPWILLLQRIMAVL